MKTTPVSIQELAGAFAIGAVERGVTLAQLKAPGACLPSSDLDYVAVQFGRLPTQAEKKALWSAYVSATQALIFSRN